MKCWFGFAAAAAVLVSASAAIAEPADIREAARKHAETLRANEALVHELAALSAMDQLIRERFLDLRKDADAADRDRLDEVWYSDYKPFDQRHTARLKVLLEDRGWFSYSEVGKRVADNAFHIVQHSGDLELMKSVLAAMELMLAAEEANPRLYALLYDRTATTENRPQRYGTQGTDCAADGKHAVPRNLEDPVRLDVRRAEVGLEPIAEYLAGLDRLYGVCTPPKPKPQG